jgi:hypothetical protein
MSLPPVFYDASSRAENARELGGLCVGCRWELSVSERESGHRFCHRCHDQMDTKRGCAMANTPIDSDQAAESLRHFRDLPLPKYAPYAWMDQNSK